MRVPVGKVRYEVKIERHVADRGFSSILIL